MSSKQCRGGSPAEARTGWSGLWSETLMKVQPICEQSSAVLCSAPSVPQPVFTITEKAPPVPYDCCVGVPISRLLTVGSTPV